MFPARLRLPRAARYAHNRDAHRLGRLHSFRCGGRWAEDEAESIESAPGPRSTDSFFFVGSASASAGGPTFVACLDTPALFI